MRDEHALTKRTEALFGMEATGSTFGVGVSDIGTAGRSVVVAAVVGGALVPMALTVSS